MNFFRPSLIKDKFKLEPFGYMEGFSEPRRLKVNLNDPDLDKVMKSMYYWDLRDLEIRVKVVDYLISEVKRKIEDLNIDG